MLTTGAGPISCGAGHIRSLKHLIKGRVGVLVLGVVPIVTEINIIINNMIKLHILYVHIIMDIMDGI